MKTIEVFVGADLRCSHFGLQQLAKKHNVDVLKLPVGSAVAFINNSKDRLKVLSWNGVLSYKNFEGKKQKLDLDALSEIPRALSPTGEMDYPKALRETLKKKLGLRRFQHLEKL